jgi:hypothetical protein
MYQYVVNYRIFSDKKQVFDNIHKILYNLNTEKGRRSLMFLVYHCGLGYDNSHRGKGGGVRLGDDNMQRMRKNFWYVGWFRMSVMPEAAGHSV